MFNNCLSLCLQSNSYIEKNNINTVKKDYSTYAAWLPVLILQCAAV